MTPLKKQILKGVLITVFVVGAVLVGVGSAGAATPLIVTGILLLMMSGAGGFMVAMEPSTPATPFTSRTA